MLTDARGLDQWRPIRVPSTWMANAEPRSSRGGDSEKITINLGYVDLGQIDLIVSDGFYANRTDFIRTAIRNHLDKHKEALAKSVERKSFDVGLHDYSREFLEELQRSGQTVNVRVIGLVRIANDVSAELARATIASISVLGALQASATVKTALSDRLS
jgi:Arc/MetJ-type ribon-helix-helix transcriptional regulator